MSKKNIKPEEEVELKEVETTKSKKEKKKKKSTKKNILDAESPEVNEVVEEPTLPPQANNAPITIKTSSFNHSGEVGTYSFDLEDADSGWACARDIESWLKVLTTGKGNVTLLCGKPYTQSAVYMVDMSYDGNTSNWQKFSVVEMSERDLRMRIDVFNGQRSCLGVKFAKSSQQIVIEIQPAEVDKLAVMNITLPLPPPNMCRHPLLFTLCPFAFCFYFVCGDQIVVDSMSSRRELLVDHFNSYVIISNEMPKLGKSRSLSSNLVPKMSWLSIRSSKSKKANKEKV